MKTCVIIPAFNEVEAIADIVKKIRQLNIDVLVIDDGSCDNTFRIAKESGAIVLRNETNQGKGASLIKGFNYALRNNYDAVVTMDGDGQHLPDDLHLFIQQAMISQSDVFIGNRMQMAGNMPWIRFCTNKIMSWLISLLIKQKIPDTQCGFRLIKKNVLKKIKLNTSKFELESEFIIKSARSGFKIDSVPIKTVYKGQKSSINPFIDTIRFFRFLFSQIWITKH